MTSIPKAKQPHPPFNIFVLCTGNSPHSLLPDTYRMLTNRIRLIANLPIESLDQLAIKRNMDDIGHTNDASQPA